MEKLIKHNMTVQYHEKHIKKKKLKKSFWGNVKSTAFLLFFFYEW